MIARIIAICVLGVGFAWPAHAAESYDNCTGFITTLPTTITTQGTWCLKNNLSTSVTSGNAITVNANNVTIDCNYFKVGGLGAGLATLAAGIRANNRVNVVVRHCSVRGFAYGAILLGSYNTVEDSAFDLNTNIGIYLSGDGSVVRGNQVSDTGGSSSLTSSPGGVVTVDGQADVIDNTVRGVNATSGVTTGVFGIYTSQNSAGNIAQNRVSGLNPVGAGTRYAINNDGANRLSIRDNSVANAGSAVSGDIGIYCNASPASIARDNVIVGFVSPATAISGCVDYANASY